VTGGAIWLDKSRVDTLRPEERGFGMVFQNYALFPHLNVRQNIGFGLKMRGKPKAEIDRKVDEALNLVRLRGQENKLPGQLSGGQQQRVAIARAIVIEPPLVLMDEPLSNLDAKLRLEMRAEIRRIHNELGATTIYVTHDQDEALTMSNRIAVFNDGRVEQIGTPAEVYERPANQFVTGFVGISNLLERDGRRFTVRPEKVRLLDGGGGDTGLHTERGVVREVAYAGMITRYLVELDAGGELQVVHQNLETSSSEALEQRGRQVTVGWRPDQAVPVHEQTRGEESQ
jgi:putative spermidine/putrescine transport system ATP-binding protein